MAKKTQKIHDFILNNVESNPNTIARITIDKFGFSRQAVVMHLRKLIEKGSLEASGTTRNRTYKLKPIVQEEITIPITSDLAEDEVWHDNIKKLLSPLPENVRAICFHGFTEMFNNVLDHSEASNVTIAIKRTATSVDIMIIDNGVGIFNKIKNVFNLKDHRQAILELAKGKLTTDPENHSGEGIFFSSRMFDEFAILSSSLSFIHNDPDGDWLIENHEDKHIGTTVNMRISLKSTRTIKKIFNKHAPEFETNGFSKTHVPIALHKLGEENFVSRSQAKRVLSRFENFKEVFLDFTGVNSIGQAFADEIFRVFKKHNPKIKLTRVNANKEIIKMIKRVTGQSNNLSDN